MKILNAIGVATLLFVALMLSSNESFSQEDDCNLGPNHVIQVRVGDDGKAVLKYRGGSGDEVEVCKGDNVKWVLTGSNRNFSVDFNYENGAPFGNPPGQKQKRDSSNDEIDVDIDSSAEAGDYDYDVAFGEDEPMDPKIIVRD